MFGRVKPIDHALSAAERNSLRRSLGVVQLTLLGIGSIIGTGIFVLTAAAAQKAGPGMMVSFGVAGLVCILAALCYAELATMMPVAGAAFTFTYSVLGEMLAWTVGWALILEYAVAASAVSVGWSGYFSGTVLRETFGISLPPWLAAGPYVPGGLINLPAVCIATAVTCLLMVGTSESAKLNAFLVSIKVAALTLFIGISLPNAHVANFQPFAPAGVWGHAGLGISGAAATIFFAFVGFDAVATAAEETRNAQRNVPIGIIASIGICTLFYILVAAGAVGAIGGQPVMGGSGIPLNPGSETLAAQCRLAEHREALVCSNEALAHVLRAIGHKTLGNWIGYAAFLALPSVVLVLLFAQARIFFVMSRDGLLPAALSRIHARWRTPHIVTALTGAGVALAAAFLPVGRLADVANSGTLYAFFMVAIAVMLLRRREPLRPRRFRTPALRLVGPATVFGTAALFISLPLEAQLVFPCWGAAGLVIYFLYGRPRSHLSSARTGVPEPSFARPHVPGVDPD